MSEPRDGQATVPDFASPRSDGPGGDPPDARRGQWRDPRSSSFVPGAIIGDVWEVERTLGKGGMGSVYRCHNKHAPRILAAIKLLDPAFQYHPEAKARFLREAEILYTVDHPNVVRVSNVHLDANPPYLEMEFVDGVSLEDELGQFGALPMEVALDRAKQLAAALRYLHRKNIFHRDVKPQNILIRKDGTPKLVDFGLAVEHGGDRITQQEVVNFGTVSYCPPEWGRVASLDPASWDVYALGVVLYEMLTGTVAFPVSPQADPRRQMAQVIADKQRIEAMDPGPRFEPGLREAVRRATHREPSERHADAKAFLAALEQVDFGWTPAAGADRVPVRPAGAEPAARKGGWLGLVGVIGAVGGMSLAIGLVVALGLLLAVGLRPATRDVEVMVGGVDATVPVSLRVADQPASRVAGLRHHVLRVPVGDVDVDWAAGEGCVAPCDQGSCPAWCTSGRTAVRVEDGEGSALVVLEVDAAAPRAVEVVVPTAAPGFARLGDRQAPFVNGTARFEAVQPGRFTVVAGVGDCAPGCDADCGAACAVASRDVVVGAGAAPMILEIPLQPPAPPEPAPVVQPVVAPSSRPGPAPVARGPGVQVTRAQFAAWLRDHPEWARDQALADGRVDDEYLSRWAAGAPPSPADAPVTQVTWGAAAAFCAQRGGLAAIDAEPTTWKDLPMMEWRAGEGGERRWRRMDGDVNRFRIGDRESNSGTTFRCSR